MIDFHASLSHYVDHLAPIWRALPDDHRGTFYLGRRQDAHLRAITLGVDPGRRGTIPAPDGTPTCVASYQDMCMTEGRPLALVEHGAGQAWGNENPGYSGGRDRSEVGLFIVPSQTVADRNLERYPDATAAVVGCPARDPWHLSPTFRPALTNGDARPVVAFTFHWDCPGWVEQGSAFDAFAPYLPAVFSSIRAQGGTVLGHSHPRRDLSGFYRSQGVEWVADFADILDRADLLVFDVTSAGPEFASTGRPVVVCDDPAWRTDLGWWWRFQSPASEIGVHALPETLSDAIDLALADPPALRAARETAVAEVYAYCDGHASERAAAALLAWEPDPTKVRQRSGRA